MKQFNNIICRYEGCDKDTDRLGYCVGHYSKYNRWGTPDGKPREYTHTPKVLDNGYVGWTDKNDPTANPSGKVFEHRKVMAEKIGRPLVKGESVHHINGDKTDNRPENLELWSKSQPYGQRVIDKIRHARYILELYADIEEVLEDE